MNCRERALAALNHHEADRVPLDFGGRQTTRHFAAHQALMEHLGLTGPEPPLRSYHTYLVEPDPQLLQRFERVGVVFFPKAPSSYVFTIDQAYDVFWLKRDRVGVDTAFMIDSLHIPLTAEGSMSAVGRTVIGAV